MNHNNEHKPHVFIVILNYKNWMDVQECLESIFRSGYEQFTVIVIDNDSKNNSLEHLMRWADERTSTHKPLEYAYYKTEAFKTEIIESGHPKLLFVQNNINAGFAAGLNPVLSCLQQENAYIWLLNPDMVLEGSTLEELIAFGEANVQRSIIGAVIKYYREPEKIHLYAGGSINFNTATVKMATRKEDCLQLDYVSGGSLFTHAANFHELGLLPEDYFLYWEETDWCYAAKKKGYSLLLCEKAVCYDKVSTTIGKSYLADYYYTRNGLKFLQKYKKEKINTAVFFAAFRFLKRIVTGRLARAKGVYKGIISFLKEDKHENR